ncbi:DUF4367 domain-containing protein [Tissierella praeacuta]|uniref:DUF4367 domain-containing protein n=1 Tax=Tissierella praeacuta TaxID=43131 RepID=UPI001F3E7453|nr:DUF4367 domain-containing protein [Tissierella praeacuta]
MNLNKKNIEDRFSIDIDDYLNGKEPPNYFEEEYKELLQLGKLLSHKDFSKNSNKEEIFNKTLKNINEYGGKDNMKKSSKFKHPMVKVASVALVCILGVSTMRTSFAQELVDKVVRTITLGHVTVIEEESVESLPVPEELKGKIFDKHGKPIEVFLGDKTQKMYTADGEEIGGFSADESGNIEIVTADEKEKRREIKDLIVKNPSELNNHTCFDVKLPSYLPNGYKFDRAEFFRENENDIVENSKYIALFFTNDKTGEYIYMQQRFADEETAYETGAKKVEKININGVDALLYDNNLDWEDNGVIYMLNGRGIAKDELIKMGESFK